MNTYTEMPGNEENESADDEKKSSANAEIKLGHEDQPSRYFAGGAASHFEIGFFHQMMPGWFPMPLWKASASKMGLRCNMNA